MWVEADVVGVGGRGGRGGAVRPDTRRVITRLVESDPWTIRGGGWGAGSLAVPRMAAARPNMPQATPTGGATHGGRPTRRAPSHAQGRDPGCRLRLVV